MTMPIPGLERIDGLRTAPRVVVYAVCWNEARLLPYFLRHYSWAEKIVIYDNCSDDGSQELASSWPRTEVRSYDTNGQYRERTLLDIKNHCWKEARGHGIDYVIVVDVDEFVYAENLSEELNRLRSSGATIIQTNGFEMVAEAFPQTAGQITEVVNRGKSSVCYSKCCVFQPDDILQIKFDPGAHICHPIGAVRWPQSTTLKLLHMRNLGFAHLRERNAGQAARLCAENKAKGWARQVETPEDALRGQFDKLLREAAKVL